MEVNDLRGINVFVGGNNSGKTSVLETIALLCNPSSGTDWVTMINRRDHGGLDESMVMSLRWCFGQARQFQDPAASLEDKELLCYFSAHGDHAIRRMACRYTEFFGLPLPKADPMAEALSNRSDTPVRHAQLVTELEWDLESSPKAFPKHEEERDVPSAVTLVLDETARSIGSARTLSGRIDSIRLSRPHAALLPYSYQLNSAQVLARSSQLFLDDSSKLIDLMQQFDGDVLKVEVGSFTGLRPAIYIKHRRLGVAPLSAFGDAMRRCLLLSATLAGLGSGGVLLLDEIEVGIHKDSLPKVFRWLVNAARQVGVQVFATTHSLEVLDALLAAEVGEEDLAAYRIKQGDERTDCQRFSFDSLKRLRYERGLDIR